MVCAIEKTMRCLCYPLCTSRSPGSEIIQDSTLKEGEGKSVLLRFLKYFLCSPPAEIIAEIDPRPFRGKPWHVHDKTTVRSSLPLRELKRKESFLADKLNA
jgi:hypothetical protein